ncbi:MAG: hypothetical protein ACJAZ3_001281 [Sphingobacteriales bacterium]|jgi:hypothetical protein
MVNERGWGIKVHTQINLQENVPKIIWFSAATTHDKKFLKHIQLEKGKIAVFDKEYNDYKTFDELVSFCRLHLFNYIHLMKFLENLEKDWLKE